MYAVLTILNYLVARIAPQSQWKSRLCALFDDYPQIDKRRMGFPDGWESTGLWKGEAKAS